MDKTCKNGKTDKSSSRLSLYPLEFEEAVKGLLEIKSPEIQVAVTYHCKEGDKVNGNKD